MKNYGQLREKEGRHVLVFERKYPFSPQKVFRCISEPKFFTQWYPFATGEMNLRDGGKIKFDDGEGSLYEAIITEYNPPKSFCFQEVDDLLEMRVEGVEEGCVLTFIHTFDNREMVKYIAAGWHRCLDVLGLLIQEKEVEWGDNALELRNYYERKFDN